MTQILDSLDPELGDRLDSRRDAIAHGASVSSHVAAGLAMASIPVALAALSRDALAQGALPQQIVDVLNFALTLEYLESTFYQTGVVDRHVVPSSDFAVFDQIRKHENEHVKYLQTALGSAAVKKPTFDFSGGSGSGKGPFGDPFANYDTFKALAQAFEDTGVRAYKGQAPNLIGNKAVLTVALQIHSVEARHASEVRRLRGNFTNAPPHQGWITLNETDIPGAAASYAGEENVTQAGIDVTTLGFVAEDVAEAFDEPLTKEAVLKIASLFIAAA